MEKTEERRRKMPKWKSPLFSDIRNAIGDNVVFSQWKGRPFFRSYVIPANPKTKKQQAVRLNNTDLVKRYQGIMLDADAKAAWNESALAYLISGYNLFVKWGRMSKVAVSPASGGLEQHFTVTYTCGIPLARAKIYVFNGATWVDKTPGGGLEAGQDKTADIGTFTAGSYEVFLADVATLILGDQSPQDYQAITKWEPDLTEGTDVPAEFAVSA
jgi:hypothetical protein